MADRWTRWRIAGTAVLAAATAVPLAMGLWSAWTFLFKGMPMPIGFLAMLGAASAPVFLVRDIVLADRQDRKNRANEPEKPIESVD